MIFGKQNLLLTVKIFSSICLVLLFTIFVQILRYDNTKNIKIKEIENKFEIKRYCLNDLSRNIFWDFEKVFTCNKIEADFGLFYNLSENRYVYYSFALFLGGVINLHKIIKIGVF